MGWDLAPTLRMSCGCAATFGMAEHGGRGSGGGECEPGMVYKRPNKTSNNFGHAREHVWENFIFRATKHVQHAEPQSDMFWGHHGLGTAAEAYLECTCNESWKVPPFP